MDIRSRKTVRSSEQISEQISEHIFAPNGGYCLYRQDIAVWLDVMTEEYIISFSVRDIKPPQPPSPPAVKGAVSLFNPSEIQLEKKDAYLAEEKNSSSAQGGNPFRKAASGRNF